jgi:hypothetical protein
MAPTRLDFSRLILLRSLPVRSIPKKSNPERPAEVIPFLKQKRYNIP